MTQVESLNKMSSTSLSTLDADELQAWRKQIHEIMKPAEEFMSTKGEVHKTSCKAVGELIGMIKQWDNRIRKMQRERSHEPETIAELIVLRDHVRDVVIPERQEWNDKLKTGVDTAKNVIATANKSLSKIKLLEVKQNSDVYKNVSDTGFSFDAEIKSMRRDLATLKALESLKSV